MKEIIKDNHHVFNKNQVASRELSNIRHNIYHDALVKYGGPTQIQKYLMDTYNYSVNQSTIYNAWFKIKEKRKELSARQFIELKFGKDAYPDKNVEALMYEYLIYHLRIHMNNDFKYRHDLKHKAEDIDKMLDENGYRNESMG